MLPDLYFDANGSTPLHPRVLETCQGLLADLYGNPSAAHAEGRRVRHALDLARATIARAIGASAGEVWITSGGTESNNWALEGVASRSARRHLVLSRVEHKSVIEPARELERRGYELEWLPVDAAGAVQRSELERVLRDDTLLVSVMMANNETGVVQPVRELAELCRARGVLFHTDAVATLGKLPVDVRAIGCDLLTLASHKLYAPKGCGVLYVRKGVPIAPLILGCGQQDGMRGGTENALATVGFARALELLERGELVSPQALGALRDELWLAIRERFPCARRNGAGSFLPNTLNVCFPGASSSEAQAALAELGISVSSGASGGGANPSHVLCAMGLDARDAAASLRFTLGRSTTRESLRALVDALVQVLPGAAPKPKDSR
ncbi:MAG: cysteine desulfurase [Planctomycetes bacterium]|nr:cysteine desulfurase [Planctomycetota bacterium]